MADLGSRQRPGVVGEEVGDDRPLDDQVVAVEDDGEAADQQDPVCTASADGACGCSGRGHVTRSVLLERLRSAAVCRKPAVECRRWPAEWSRPKLGLLTRAVSRNPLAAGRPVPCRAVVACGGADARCRVAVTLRRGPDEALRLGVVHPPGWSRRARVEVGRRCGGRPAAVAAQRAASRRLGAGPEPPRGQLTAGHVPGGALLRGRPEPARCRTGPATRRPRSGGRPEWVCRGPASRSP